MKKDMKLKLAAVIVGMAIAWMVPTSMETVYAAEVTGTTETEAVETVCVVDETTGYVKAEVVKVEPKVEKIPFIPLMDQGDYDDVKYGRYGTVANSGCGIVCLAMAATYLTDEWQDPVDLADRFGRYNTSEGSAWALFEDAAEVLGFGFQEQTGSWKVAKEALENGQLVICSQRNGLFTNGGHYILLGNITDDGKVMVFDPNGGNWDKNQTMKDGFGYGFSEEQITKSAKQYWIFSEKEI